MSSTPTFGLKLDDVDDVMNDVPAADDVSVFATIVAENHSNGYTTASSGMGMASSTNWRSPLHQWKYNATWQSKMMPYMDEIATEFNSGKYNKVYGISNDTANTPELEAVRAQLKLGYPDTVFRLNITPIGFGNAVKEAGFALLAASHGFGPPIHCVATAFSDRPDVKEPGRMLLVMDRAEGSVGDLAKMFKTIGYGGYPLGWADDVAKGIYGACVKLSNRSIIDLDLKLGNMVFYNRGADIKIIDFDPGFVFHLEVHPKVALLVNFTLIAVHVRNYFRNAGAAPAILRLFEPKLLELYRQAKNGEFDGAEILSVYMPVDSPSSSSRYFHIRGLTGEQRLKGQFPAVVYDYFLDKHNSWTKDAAKWPWKFSGQHRRYPLVPQLLRNALFFNAHVPPQYKDLLAY